MIRRIRLLQWKNSNSCSLSGDTTHCQPTTKHRFKGKNSLVDRSIVQRQDLGGIFCQLYNSMDTDRRLKERINVLNRDSVRYTICRFVVEFYRSSVYKDRDYKDRERTRNLSCSPCFRSFAVWARTAELVKTCNMAIKTRLVVVPPHQQHRLVHIRLKAQASSSRVFLCDCQLKS